LPDRFRLSARSIIDRYIIQAFFSQERMTYIAGESKVVYKVKDNDYRSNENSTVGHQGMG